MAAWQWALFGAIFTAGVLAALDVTRSIARQRQRERIARDRLREAMRLHAEIVTVQDRHTPIPWTEQD